MNLFSKVAELLGARGQQPDAFQGMRLPQPHPQAAETKKNTPENVNALAAPFIRKDRQYAFVFDQSTLALDQNAVDSVPTPVIGKISRSLSAVRDLATDGNYRIAVLAEPDPDAERRILRELSGVPGLLISTHSGRIWETKNGSPFDTISPELDQRAREFRERLRVLSTAAYNCKGDPAWSQIDPRQEGFIITLKPGIGAADNWKTALQPQLSAEVAAAGLKLAENDDSYVVGPALADRPAKIEIVKQGLTALASFLKIEPGEAPKPVLGVYFTAALNEASLIHEVAGLDVLRDEGEQHSITAAAIAVGPYLKSLDSFDARPYTGHLANRGELSILCEQIAKRRLDPRRTQVTSRIHGD